MLKLCYAPRCPRANFLMAGTDQQQIRQHRYAKGVRDAPFFRTDLVFTQPEVRLQLSIDLLYGPPSLIGTHDLSRRPLVQIGHQDFGMCQADVSPFFTQYHCDVTDVSQTEAVAIHPEGSAALGAWKARHPD